MIRNMTNMTTREHMQTFLRVNGRVQRREGIRPSISLLICLLPLSEGPSEAPSQANSWAAARRRAPTPPRAPLAPPLLARWRRANGAGAPWPQAAV
jgi:hypothetical protein